MKPELIWEIEGGLQRTSLEVYKASEVRSEWLRALLKMFDLYDYLVLPSAQVFAFPVEQQWPTEVAGRKMDTYHRWMEVVLLTQWVTCHPPRAVGMNAS